MLPCYLISWFGGGGREGGGEWSQLTNHICINAQTDTTVSRQVVMLSETARHKTQYHTNRNIKLSTKNNFNIS